MVETKSGTLKKTLIAKKVIKHLIDPNQQGQKFTELKSLKEGSLESKKVFGQDLYSFSNSKIKR